MHAFRLTLAILIVWTAPVEAALWTGIIDATRAVNWSNAVCWYPQPHCDLPNTQSGRKRSTDQQRDRRLPGKPGCFP